MYSEQDIREHILDVFSQELFDKAFMRIGGGFHYLNRKGRDEAMPAEVRLKGKYDRAQDRQKKDPEKHKRRMGQIIAYQRRKTEKEWADLRCSECNVFINQKPCQGKKRPTTCGNECKKTRNTRLKKEAS